MSASSKLLEELESGLDAALLTLMRIDELAAAQGERIGAWIDRLTAQLHDLTPPAPR